MAYKFESEVNMGTIIFYLSVAALCFIVYLVLDREIYLSGKSVKICRGKIDQIITDKNTVQYLVVFYDKDGNKHLTISPHYSLEGKAFKVGQKIDLTYRQFRIFSLTIDAIRIENANLIKKEPYKALLAMGAILVALAVIRIITML